MLHIGKCDTEVKTTVPIEFDTMIREKAAKLRCFPSDLVRDALYLAFTGETYATHVANDRASVFSVEGRGQGDSSPNDADLKLHQVLRTASK